MSDQTKENLSFPRFFNAQELGHSLKEVATDLINTTHQEVVSRWFHSNKDADLYIWLDKGENILKQQLSFYGQIVEWNLIEGVKTGLIIEDENRNSGVSPSEVVQFDSRPQRPPLEQAVELLKHMTALKEDERRELVANFVKPSMANTIDPQEFVDRFGSYLNPPKKRDGGSVVSIFARIRRWFQT
jgi:hypothetical protein